MLVLCILSGCNRANRPDGLPPLSSCEITITQGGEPLEGAFVQLMPESGVFEWAVAGHTNASGVAKILTHAQFPGAPEGTFKVLVSKTELEPSKFGPEPDDVNSPERAKWYDQVTNEKRDTIMYVKPEYDKAHTTPLSITITRGRNRETFDVGEPVEIKK